MAINLNNFNSWIETQIRCRYLLGINDESIKSLPYQGLGHALVDIVYGLKELWPTRKSLAISSYGCPIIRESIQGLALSGASLVSIENPRKTSIDEWINSLPKDLCAAILVRDHSVTGEILTVDEELVKLNDKRIPHIEIQYGWSWTRATAPLPFGIQIRVIDASRAIVVVGSRVRFNNHSANLMNWLNFEWEKPVIECTVHNREAKSIITTFEEQIVKLQSGIELYPIDSSRRLYDRSLLILKGVNGDFFLHHLLKSLDVPPLKAAGFESRCETTNLNRWNGPYVWNWWGEKALEEFEQRSLVLFSSAFIKQQLNAEKVNKVYLECLSRVQKEVGALA